MITRSSLVEPPFVLRHAFLSCALIFCCLVGTIRAQSSTSETKITRWLERETISVVRCDAERLSRSLSSDQVQRMIDQVRQEASVQEATQAIEQNARRLLTEFCEAGGREVWILLNPVDLTSGSPLVIVRGSSDTDANRLDSWLERQRNSELQVLQQDATTWLIGHRAVLERVGQMQPSDRPDLTEALMTAERSPVVAVLALGPDQRRVFARPSRRYRNRGAR